MWVILAFFSLSSPSGEFQAMKHPMQFLRRMLGFGGGAIFRDGIFQRPGVHWVEDFQLKLPSAGASKNSRQEPSVLCRLFKLWGCSTSSRGGWRNGRFFEHWNIWKFRSGGLVVFETKCIEEAQVHPSTMYARIDGYEMVGMIEISHWHHAEELYGRNT